MALMPKSILLAFAGAALLTAFAGAVQAQSSSAVAVPEAPVVYERVVSQAGAAVAEPAPASPEVTASQEQGGAEAASAVAAPQRSVRTRQQDAGSSIEELRVGGQTQEITVQPAGSAPAYQVRPSNNHSYRQENGRHSGDGTNGPRVWNVLEF